MSAAVSDTPKTDELAKREFITDGVWIRHARELERENAALRQTLADMPTCRCGLSTDEQCALSVENADMRDTLDAVIAADERAVELWRAAHPGNELVIPDRGRLVGWLLEQNAALRELTSTLGAPNHINVPVEQWRELRADKARLDWILTDDGGHWVNWMYEKEEWTPELKASRDAIDACLKPSTWKEAQP